MLVRIFLGLTILIFAHINSGNAAGTENIKEYFSDTACRVKAAEPSRKRVILEKSLVNMSKALDMAQRSPGISQDDRDGIDRLKLSLQEKQDELAGKNGFERISDEHLNAFSGYVVQDMEQAQRTVTISVVTLLLIIIIVLLLAG